MNIYCLGSSTGYKVRFTVPVVEHDVIISDTNTYSQFHLEVDSGNIPGPFNFTGPFTATVLDASGNTVASWTNNITSLSRNLEGGALTTLPEMTSVVHAPCVVTVGFYDAGSGVAGLTKGDECFMTVTPNRANWMDQVASIGSAQAAKPFTTFVLPCPHNCGMTTMQYCDTILSNTESVAEVAATIIVAVPVVGAAIVAAVGGALAFNSARIYISATDQSCQLTGPSRPTLASPSPSLRRTRLLRCPILAPVMSSSASPLPDNLYYTLLLIPETPLGGLLVEVVQFLLTNPTEIVVVQIRHDGIDSSCAVATTDEVNTYVANALKSAAPLTHGTFQDISKSLYADLLSQGKRLIVLQDAAQYSSYSDGACTTLGGHSIAAVFPKFLADAASCEPGTQIAMWQCQVTPTNITPVAVYTAVAPIGATSSLFATKAWGDVITLPWLRDKVFPAMPATTLQAIMNDFFDGRTADVAIKLSQQYLSQ